MDALGINILMVATPSLLKEVVTLGVRMCDPEDLTRGLQPFFLGKHTAAHRKKVSTAAEKYSTVVGGGAATSLDDANIVADSNGVSLPQNFLQAQGQLTRNRVICA